MSKINAVRFDGYKSFPIDVSNEISINPYISVFIGKNNCGKSSCIDVLETAFGGQEEKILHKEFHHLSISTPIKEEFIGRCFSGGSWGGHGISGEHNEYGRKFIDTLQALNENLWKEKTADMNKDLKKISKGQLNPQELINKAKMEIKEIFEHNIEVKKVESSIGKQSIGKCPICGKDIVENSYFFSCCGYKEGCKFGISKKIASKTISKTIAKQLLNKGETNLISGFKSKSGNCFKAKLIIENDKVQFKF